MERNGSTVAKTQITCVYRTGHNFNRNTFKTILIRKMIVLILCMCCVILVSVAFSKIRI